MLLTEILVIVLIISLLGYIVYLHIKLVRKNLLIESTIKRLGGLDKSWGADEIMNFLREIRNIGNYNSFLRDKLFGERPMSFLLENENESRIFIHYTKYESDARNIIKEGFRFADSFYKTALPVSKDKLDLMIKHNGRKSFGDYMIVLAISQKVFDHYSGEIEKRGIKGVAPENIIVDQLPVRNDNSDLEFILPNRFVKGFINHRTGEIVSNPDFEPSYESPAFMKNLELSGTG